MTRPIVPIIIAGLSTFIHLVLTIITIFGIILEINNKRGVSEYSDGDSNLSNFSVVMLTLLSIATVVEIAVLVASICLIVGIKMECPHFVATWLYLTMAYMILSFADFIGGYNALGYLFPIKLAIFLLHVAMWYPIFKYWRNLRLSANSKAQQSVTADVESSIYPQLANVGHSRQVTTEEHGKLHNYTPLS